MIAYKFFNVIFEVSLLTLFPAEKVKCPRLFPAKISTLTFLTTVCVNSFTEWLHKKLYSWVVGLFEVNIVWERSLTCLPNCSTVMFSTSDFHSDLSGRQIRYQNHLLSFNSRYYRVFQINQTAIVSLHSRSLYWDIL